MAFQRPTLSELVDRIQQDFVSRLTLVGAVLRRSLVYVFSRVMAGAAHMLHGHLEFLSRQMFPDVSDGAYLVRQAGTFGLTQVAPSFATGTATVTGVNGTTIPAGATLQRSDGAEYTTNADATIASGAATLAVTATIAGAVSTLAAGVSLAFESPIAGVSGTATVVSSTVDGSDLEAVEALRARFLERLQSPPHGGNAADFKAWALEVAGVTRAWVYPQELGAGTVTVRFMRDNDSGSPIPDSGEVAAVQAYIDALRPVTATLTVVAPVATPVNLTVGVLPNTTAVKAAVSAELADMIARLAEPGGTLFLSQIEVAIGSAAGLTSFNLTSPSADVSHTTGQIATLGTVTFT